VSFFTFAYSTDGATFQPWGTIDTGFATAITNMPFTLSPVLNAVNDADVVYVRMTVSGSTGGINSARVDNVQFNATAVPEPGTATALFAGFSVCALSRRRRQDP
jgi:hypothetical protein